MSRHELDILSIILVHRPSGTGRAEVTRDRVLLPVVNFHDDGPSQWPDESRNIGLAIIEDALGSPIPSFRFEDSIPIYSAAWQVTVRKLSRIKPGGEVTIMGLEVDEILLEFGLWADRRTSPPRVWRLLTPSAEPRTTNQETAPDDREQPEEAPREGEAPRD